jgi:hypothetical protein
MGIHKRSMQYLPPFFTFRSHFGLLDVGFVPPTLAVLNLFRITLRLVGVVVGVVVGL